MGVVAVTDPSGGSDVAGIKTSAKLEGDNYILNGRKCFITNSHFSDFWVVIARTEKVAGVYRLLLLKRISGSQAGEERE